IVKTAQDIRTIVAFADGDPKKEEMLSAAGVEMWKLPGTDGRVDVISLIKKLGESGIDSVFVEGGGILNDTLRAMALVDRVECFVAPKIFGGADAKSPVEGTGIEAIGDALELTLEDVRRIGGDVLLTYVKKGENVK
ncbi:MAG: RibD family protein, partial [Lachnospiraceae bacterium]|nr:RibD family protein [Lachnospiraceae bacterium]